MINTVERLTTRHENGMAYVKGDFDELMLDVIERLAEYEEAEEEGRLVKLKRKIGKKVYVIRYGERFNAIVSGLIFGVTHDGLEIVKHGQTLGFRKLEFMLMDAKNVFDSRQEAKREFKRRQETAKQEDGEDE